MNQFAHIKYFITSDLDGFRLMTTYGKRLATTPRRDDAESIAMLAQSMDEHECSPMLDWSGEYPTWMIDDAVTGHVLGLSVTDNPDARYLVWIGDGFGDNMLAETNSAREALAAWRDMARTFTLESDEDPAEPDNTGGGVEFDPREPEPEEEDWYR